jgi:hypothetical protein
MSFLVREYNIWPLHFTQPVERKRLVYQKAKSAGTEHVPMSLIINIQISSNVRLG